MLLILMIILFILILLIISDFNIIKNNLIKQNKEEIELEELIGKEKNKEKEKSILYKDVVISCIKKTSEELRYFESIDFILSNHELFTYYKQIDDRLFELVIKDLGVFFGWNSEGASTLDYLDNNNNFLNNNFFNPNSNKQNTTKSNDFSFFDFNQLSFKSIINNILQAESLGIIKLNIKAKEKLIDIKTNFNLKEISLSFVFYFKDKENSLEYDCYRSILYYKEEVIVELGLMCEDNWYDIFNILSYKKLGFESRCVNYNEFIKIRFLKKGIRK